jgi:putative phage-type endonuclease
MEQNTPEWFEARKGRVTASMVGAILGLAPYMSRDDAMRRMVRDYHGAPSEFTGNDATAWGTHNEAGARFDFELETGISVQQCGFFAKDDWAGASPDGLLSDSGLIEIKCPFGIRNDENPKFKTADEQPHYFAQMQFQMWVTGRMITHFWQWTPKKTYLEVIHYSQPWIDENLPVLRAFYDEYLKELNNQDHLAPKRKPIETVKARQLLQEYDELTTAIELGEARKKEIIAEFEELAGGRDALIWGRKFTKVEKAGAVSYAKVVKDHLPGFDLEPYRGKPSSYWKLS